MRRAEDVGEARGAEDVGEARRAEDVGKARRAEDVGEARRVEDVGEARRVEDVGRGEEGGVEWVEWRLMVLVERAREENIRRHGQRERGKQGVRGGRRGRRIGYRQFSNEIRANLIDHVINYGLSLSWTESSVQYKHCATVNVPGRQVLQSTDGVAHNTETLLNI